MNKYIKKICGNKVLIYLLSRYGTYFLQFVVSISIAANLGPYYLGVYGFAMLIVSYFGKINFGIPQSLNVLLIHNKTRERESEDYIKNSIALYTLISLVVCLLFIIVKISNPSFINKFAINDYLIIICLIAIFGYYNGLMITILRVRNYLKELAFIQSSHVLLNFVSIFIWDGKTLVFVLLINQLLAHISSIVIAFYRGVVPKSYEFTISYLHIKQLLSKGFFLFIYNSCFYFILISIRTIISSNYTVTEYGFFTFAVSLASAAFLLLDSLEVVIFPKVIDKLSVNDINKRKEAIEMYRNALISPYHFVVYTALIAFPLLIYFFPKYESSLVSMNLLVLTSLMMVNNMGYTSLLIAQNKEKTASCISLLSLLLNIIIAAFLVKILHVGFSYVIIATMITYLFFSYAMMKQGMIINCEYSFKSLCKELFPFRYWIPYITAVVIAISKCENLIFIPLLLCIFFNRKDVLQIYGLAKRLLNNPRITDIS